MSKRVTIMIEDSVDSKVRILQAKRIKDTQATVSYSSLIDELVAEGLKVVKD